MQRGGARGKGALALVSLWRLPVYINNRAFEPVALYFGHLDCQAELLNLRGAAVRRNGTEYSENHAAEGFILLGGQRNAELQDTSSTGASPKSSMYASLCAQ